LSAAVYAISGKSALLFADRSQNGTSRQMVSSSDAGQPKDERCNDITGLCDGHIDLQEGCCVVR